MWRLVLWQSTMHLSPIELLLLRSQGPFVLALTTSTGQHVTALTSRSTNEPLAGSGSSRVPVSAVTRG